MVKPLIAIVTALAIGAAPAFAQSLYEHDHAWVVDFDGVERPLYGCWRLASVSHPARAEYVGNIEQVKTGLFNADGFLSERQVIAPDGVMWSQVVLIYDGQEAFLIERLDTSTEPHHWYAIVMRDGNGRPTAAVPETEAQFAGEDPNADLATYERVSCAGQ